MRKFIVLLILLAGCVHPEPVPQVNWPGGLRYVLEPAGVPIGVVILHQGHNPFDAPNDPISSLVPVSERLVQEGYAVACFEMPPMWHSGSIEKFYNPVLQYIETVTGGPIFMIGLSGGGWTTTVTTAISNRITKGYSVAGDHPELSLAGDWEQQNPPYPYRTMYQMAISRLLHVYNAYDSCCYRYAGWTEEEIGTPFIVDYTHQNHMISPWAIEQIIEDMADERIRFH